MGSDNEYEHQMEWRKVERGYDRLERDMEGLYGVGVMDLSLMREDFGSAGKDWCSGPLKMVGLINFYKKFVDDGKSE